jgi:hypothetical protein
METEAGFKVTGPRSSTITGPEMRLTAGKPRLRNNVMYVVPLFMVGGIIAEVASAINVPPQYLELLLYH